MLIGPLNGQDGPDVVFEGCYVVAASVVVLRVEDSV